jgi:hypothetical protein
VLVQDPVPIRVIAVHKETSIVRGPDGVDRSAVGLRPVPVRGARAVGLSSLSATG